MTPPWDETEEEAGSDARKSVRTERTLRRKPSMQRRERLARWLVEYAPPGVSSDEVRAHVQYMPGRYWERVNKEDLLWHLTLLHGFFVKLAAQESAGAPVVIGQRDIPDTKRSQVIVCSWDRRGLLEQVVAAFSALRIDILRSEVYTRTDNLVFDVFEVGAPAAGLALDAKQLRELSFLVEGAFSNPPRFVSVWATQFHKVLPRGKVRTPRVSFDNRSSPDHTVLRVEASDRLGLLYDLLHALTEQGLAIKQALIDTPKRVARDEFHLTDGDGRKITDLSRLRKLRTILAEAIVS